MTEQPTYRYKCGECGIDESLTMDEINAHWKSHIATGRVQEV